MGYLILLAWLAGWMALAWLIGKKTTSWVIRFGGSLILYVIASGIILSIISGLSDDNPNPRTRNWKVSDPEPARDYWAEAERKVNEQRKLNERLEAKWQLDESRAIAIVMLTPSKKGGRIRDFFERQSKVPAIRDLGWNAQEVADGFIVEKTVQAASLSSPSIYRWKVLRNETVVTMNGKAKDITR